MRVILRRSKATNVHVHLEQAHQKVSVIDRFHDRKPTRMQDRLAKKIKRINVFKAVDLQTRNCQRSVNQIKETN